jgi:subtilisin family serine protease
MFHRESSARHVRQPQLRVALLLLILLLLAAVGTPAATTDSKIGGRLAHPSRILAKLKPGQRADGKQLQDAVTATGLNVRGRFSILPNLLLLDVDRTGPIAAAKKREQQPDNSSTATRMAKLRKTGLFEYVEPDYVRKISIEPNDSAYQDGSLWGLRNTGQNGGVPGADINAATAWDLSTGSPEVIVAVLDTGIRYTHRDLAARMWRNPDEIPNNGLDDDNDGYVDNIFGINPAGPASSAGDPMDDNGHGSHTAGTIGAAANDGNRHVGVAWNIRLMACKFLDADGSGKTSDEIKCIDFAIANGARIINASYGGPGSSQAQRDAIARARDAGILFVAAAGNESADNDSVDSFPANHDLENVISVAAHDRHDQLASFSNFGANRVHLAAPGAAILSCWHESDTHYKTISGTSMAAPHVAGVAALVVSRFPGITISDLRNQLLNTTRPVPSLTGKTVTGGAVDASAAVSGQADGILELRIDPAPGATLLAGSEFDLNLRVTDLSAVIGASVTATLNGQPVDFRDDGTGVDDLAGDGIHEADLLVPVFQSSAKLIVDVSAPGKQPAHAEFDYQIAVPAPNNDFAKATILVGADASATGSTEHADTEPGEPRHTGNGSQRSIWFKWTATASGDVTIDTVGSSFDTVLAVYQGTGLATLTLVADNDDAPGLGLASSVRFAGQPGTEYHIAVDGHGGTGGDVVLHLGTLPPSPPPPNDDFNQRIDFANMNDAFTGSNVGASAEPGEPLHANVIGGHSVWFTWTASTDSTFTLSTEGSQFDTVLAVYEGTSVNGLTALATNDDNPVNGTFSLITLTVSAGKTLAIAVDGFAGAVGAFALKLDAVDLGVRPPNDTFTEAGNLSNLPTAGTGNNVGATLQAGEPVHSGNLGGRSVWWNWTSPTSQLITVDTLGSSFDTLLAVYTGSELNTLTPVAANDDQNSGSLISRVTFAAQAGVTYRIAVDGFSNTDGIAGDGDITLNIAGFNGLLSGNDDFANSSPISGLDFVHSGSNVGSTTEGFDSTIVGIPVGGTLWWSFTTPTAAYVEFSTEGSPLDTVIAVYAGNSPQNLKLIAFNDDYPDFPDRSSRLRFVAVPGLQYALVVGGYNGASGDFDMELKMLGDANFVYSSDFESAQGYLANQPLANQSGWLAEGTGISGISDSNVFGTGQSAFVGGLANGTTGATNSDLIVWQPLNVNPAPHQIIRFSTVMTVVQSLNGRDDDFGWRIYNQSAQLLAGIRFVTGTGNIELEFGDGHREFSGLQYPANSSFLLTFEVSFAGNRWSAYLEGIPIAENLPLATDDRPLNLGDFDAFVIATTPDAPGDNRMAFDRLHVDRIDLTIPPVILDEPQSVHGIEGEDLQLTVLAIGAGPLTYRWFHNDIPLPTSGAGLPQLLLTEIEDSQAGNYHVEVSNLFGTTRSAPANVSIAEQLPPAPNDHFDQAKPINTDFAVETENNTTASKEPGEPNHAGNIGGRSLWWRWTPQSSGPFSISTIGSSIDTVLAVYLADSLANLALVSENDDAQSGQRGSLVSVSAIAGQTYHIAIDGFNGDAGQIRLGISPLLSPVIGAPAPVGNGFQFHFPGEPGIRYLIEYTTNFSDWIPLADLVSSSSGIQFTDQSLMGEERRFYRTRREVQ